uniref:Uncharacterized protein n=1 Tax=Fibrocapsa japonica TaxID=94617 RepID=A0A7S2V560_9STRA
MALLKTIKFLLLASILGFLSGTSLAFAPNAFGKSLAPTRSTARHGSIKMTDDVKHNNIIPALVTGALISTQIPESAFAAAPVWVAPTKLILDPLLNIVSLAMLARVVLSWYPSISLDKAPFSYLKAPTEPVLQVTREVVPPAFGVDVSPIVWIMISSFFHEILLGQQGLLTILQNK